MFTIIENKLYQIDLEKKIKREVAISNGILKASKETSPLESACEIISLPEVKKMYATEFVKQPSSESNSELVDSLQKELEELKGKVKELTDLNKKLVEENESLKQPSSENNSEHKSATNK